MADKLILSEAASSATELERHLLVLKRRLEIEPNSYEQVLIEMQITAVRALIDGFRSRRVG